MSKELEALNKIQHDFGQLKGQELVSCYETIFNALKRLESIDNAEPSEALECLENIWCDISTNYVNEYATIKQALLNAQEPNSTSLLMQELDCKDFADLRKYARCGYEKLNKQYLKWEDLEFDNNASVKKHLKVKLGDNIYKAYYHYCFILNSELFCIENDNENLNIYITNKQFFNDLHLEVVE